MKLLLITGFFPPHAPLAATRAPAFARYLTKAGHDVHVLAPRRTDFPPVLQHDLDEDRVVFTEPLETGSRQTNPMRMPRLMVRLLYEFGIPDRSVRWLEPAIRKGLDLIADDRPDALYVSAPPHTGLMVGARLSRLTGVPWFAEFRDLWTGHGYYQGPVLRRVFEGWLEQRTLNSARGLVTVTHGWAEMLRKEWSKPVLVAMNGYDPAEFPTKPKATKTDGRLEILYAGAIYRGKRDPGPLFEALEQLGEKRKNIRLRFFGAQEQINAILESYDLGDCVESHGPISREEILKLQGKSDVLLLLRWDDPSENNIIAGKLFEYIGARRPILSVGGTEGEAADLIRNNNLGWVVRQPHEIAGILQDLIARKKRQGIAPLADDGLESFSRPIQFRKVERFIAQCIDDVRPT